MRSLMIARASGRPAAACAALLLASGVAAQPRAGDADCDRDCLRGFINAYLGAMIAHDPGALPVADGARFTEDAVTLELGGGLWQTASGLGTYRQDVLDVRGGTAATLVKVEERGEPVLLALRLGIVDREIAEIETLVVRSASEGVIFDVDALERAGDAMTLVPEPSRLESRANAIAIAERYPAGLRAGSFADVDIDVPFAPHAYRLENGRLMAGPGCTFLPGCDDIKGQRIPTLPETQHRLVAVDEALGIVLLRLDFGAGSVRDPDSSLVVFEAFKVYDGRIHAVEAIMEQTPAGSSSGWQAPGAPVADPDPERFADAIDAFRQWDAKSTPPAGATLFVGSSSIRLWETAAAFPEHTVINRGFGGSHISDVDHYYDTVVAPYAPATIVFYAGDNDIGAGKHPRRVLADFERFSQRVAAELPDTEILFVSIKPSKARWAHWPAMTHANHLIAEYVSRQPNRTYVDLATPLLDDDGRPRDVYIEDGLHLNERGYGSWNDALAPYLH